MNKLNKIQDYEVISVIESGSFGTCFKVFEKSSGKTFAWIGIDYDDRELSNLKKESLISQINALRQLKHPYIVEYYHYLINDEAKCILVVMEYCKGGDLAQLIRRCQIEKSRLEEKYIWRMLFQVCKAVQYMCHNKIKKERSHHRGITPETIFLDSRGNAKLVDFDLARIIGQNEKFACNIGSEVITGSKYEQESDVWEIGWLLYELSALKSPFEQDSRNIPLGKVDRIPEFYSGDLQKIINFILEKKHTEKPTVEMIARHPIVVRNMCDLGKDFPQLIKLIDDKAEKSARVSLNFSMSTDSTSTEYNCHKRLNNSFTPSVYFTKNVNYELKPRNLGRRNFEDETDQSPRKIFIQRNQLKERLKKIRTKENLLKKKEAALLLREQKLIERERIIERRELTVQMKKIEINNLSNKDDHDASYCSVELNDTMKSPTVAKLNKSALRPLKYFPPRRRVTFKSPKKIVSNNFKNVECITIPKPPSTDCFENRSRRKSFLSIFGFQKNTSTNHSKTNNIEKINRQETSTSTGVLKKRESLDLNLWTDENKRTAFNMLATMNENSLSRKKNKSWRQQSASDVKAMS